MKSLRDYVAETEQWISDPVEGDAFDIELAPDSLLETYVVEATEDGVVVYADERALGLLEQHGMVLEDIASYGPVGYGGMGQTFFEKDIKEHGGGIGPRQHWQSLMQGESLDEGQVKKIMHADAEQMDLEKFVSKYGDEAWVREFWNDINEPVTGGEEQRDLAHWDFGRILELAGCGRMEEDQSAGVLAQKELATDITNPMPGVKEEQDMDCYEDDMEEAKYQGREVKLGKPFLTPGGPKKRSVYVKNPKGNVVKVNFGDPDMKIKKSNPGRRKNFRARHNCANPGPRHKARYWSCRMW